MPTYEYRCPDGHDFEKFYRSIGTAESEVTCPVCGKVAERRMSRSGFAFKGSGFYLTDYGKNAHRGTAPASAPVEGGAKETPAATSDAKPAESAATAPKAAESKPAPPPPKSGSDE